MFQVFQNVGGVRLRSSIRSSKLWIWSSKLKKGVEKNVTSFKQWLGKYESENSPEGDFARDVIVDENFPIIQTKEFVEKYLTKNNASDRTMEIFYEVWDRFENRG